MFSNVNNKKGFTLVEVLFVCSIFAIMVVGIILAINRSYSFMNNVRLQVRATNFAREGVEMMFNFRDTNWRKYSGKKDEFRLCLDDDTDSSCGSVIQEGLYYIKEKSGSGVTNHYDDDHYISVEKIGISSNSDRIRFYETGFWDENFSSQRSGSKIVFTGTYSYLSGSYQDDGIWTGEQATGYMDELLGSETDFYRVVRVYGVYPKNVSSTSVKIDDQINRLKNSEPKEMRFCVKVFYRNLSTPHSTELCSIMTNFME